MAHLTWNCACGKVRATMPAEGNRIVCYCESCRAFVERLGATDLLDEWGGSDLLQTMPHKVTFETGLENLSYMKITDKGPLRWYAACCNTPIANTLPTRAFPFASFQTHQFTPEDALPPLKGHVNLSGATGRVDNVQKVSMLSLIASILGGAAVTYLTGKRRKNPFFNSAGQPIALRHDPV